MLYRFCGGLLRVVYDSFSENVTAIENTTGICNLKMIAFGEIQTVEEKHLLIISGS
jgi:hypothetical protein